MKIKICYNNKIYTVKPEHREEFNNGIETYFQGLLDKGYLELDQTKDLKDVIDEFEDGKYPNQLNWIDTFLSGIIIGLLIVCAVILVGGY